MATIPKKVKVASNPNRSGAQRGMKMNKNGSTGMMMKKKKKTSNPIQTPKKKKRPNPGGVQEIIGQPKDVLTVGVAGLAAALATRQLPQMLLSTANTGMEGYAANLATALVATWLAGAFAGPKAAWGAITGGMVILLDRVLSENVSPIAPYLALSGVGDPTAMSNMGTIRDGYYTHPGLVDGQGNLIPAQPYTDAAVAAVLAKYPQLAAPVQAAMNSGRMGAVNPSGMRRHVASGQLISSRFQSRFNTGQN